VDRLYATLSGKRQKGSAGARGGLPYEGANQSQEWQKKANDEKKRGRVQVLRQEATNSGANGRKTVTMTVYPSWKTQRKKEDAKKKLNPNYPTPQEHTSRCGQRLPKGGVGSDPRLTKNFAVTMINTNDKQRKIDGGSVEVIDEFLEMPTEHVEAFFKELNATKTTAEEKIDVMQEFGTVFSVNPDTPTATPLMQHKINLTTTTPIYIRRRKHSPWEKRIIHEYVQKMLRGGIIEADDGCYNI